MNIIIGKSEKQNCRDCVSHKLCRDNAVSWFFLFVGLIATIAIRIVNLMMDFSSLWAKIFWYIGVGGFLIYFLYKFYQDRLLQKKIEKIRLLERLVRKDSLFEQDYDFLMSVICKLKSRKDTINYFFIFFTSALALILGVYQDFLK